MVVFPNAKVNIGLQVLNKREDGYHNLESIFYPIPLYDILEVVESQSFSFQSTGLPIDINEDIEKNLVVKAYRLLKKDFNLPEVSIHLHKTIPMGAGLGGGSADGAFALKLLNTFFGLNINETALLRYAEMLGSDCPFFIHNVPTLVSGRGEIVKKIDFSLSEKWIKIIHPGIHISTKEAFSSLILNNESKFSFSNNYINFSHLSNRFINDFEQSLIPQYPILSTLKNQLLAEGAFYASLSGSGSAVFGIFDQIPKKTESTYFEFIHQL